MKLLHILFFIFFYGSAEAQYWSKRFDVEHGNDYGARILMDSNQFIILVNGLCNGTDNLCGGIIRLDSNGNLLGKTIFYDTLEFNVYEAMTLRNDTIFINCYYPDNPLFYTILAFDLSGNYLTRFDYEATGGLDGTYYSAGISTLGNRMFVAYHYKNLNDSPRYHVRGFDRNWQEVWDRKIPSDTKTWYTDIQATPDNGVAAIYSSCYPCKASVIKYDAEGSVSWNTPILGGNYENSWAQFVYLSLHPDGGYVAVWHLDTFTVGLDNRPMMILKLDSTGQIEWQKIHYSYRDHFYQQVFATKNGDIIVCGVDENLVTPQGLADSLYYFAGLVERFTPSGEMRWARRIFDVSQGEHNGVFYDGLELDDGSLVFCGEIEDTLPDDPYPYNVWVVKLDSMGCLSPGCDINQFVLNDSEPVQPTSPIEQNLFAVYPMPFTETLNIVSILGQHLPQGEYQVSLYNEQGQLLLQKPINSNLLTTLNTAFLPQGIYTLSISCDNRLIQTTYVVKAE